MSTKIRLTMAQALVRFLAAQKTEQDGRELSLFAGIFAIFGHGNVAGMGEALQGKHELLPVYRAHNEQAMAHAAIAYSKALRRRRMMACTTSVGPGATNMVTAAALAHVNRLPVLLLPGDTFANRLPDPVLQQIENFSDPTITANDCFRPVSRYWDRITRPEQLLKTLPQAMAVLTDPADCGPVTLALPQDVQTQAWDYPESFFQPYVHRFHRPGADLQALQQAAERISQASRPLIVAGGGVHYSGATTELADFAYRLNIPVCETQAGKGALPWDHACNVGAIGVTGATAANNLAAEADLIIAIGTRLQDFTTGSGLLLGKAGAEILSINVARFDAVKAAATRLQGDALRSLQELGAVLNESTSAPQWLQRFKQLRIDWNTAVSDAITHSVSELPSDAEVLGQVNGFFATEINQTRATVVCAAGGLPGELHKLWRASDTDSYHLEYGYSCMGYEIAGGLGVKMALPHREVVIMVGDGSYLMMNSEIATSVALGQKLIIVLLDNRGFGCINRLQTSLGGAGYNNLWDSSYAAEPVDIDFAAHAAALGAESEKVAGLDGLHAALQRARTAKRTYVIVIDTDPVATTAVGGTWWDVPVAETSEHDAVRQASMDYQDKKKKR